MREKILVLMMVLLMAFIFAFAVESCSEKLLHALKEDENKLKQEENDFMNSCLKDKKHYECKILWKSAH